MEIRDKADKEVKRRSVAMSLGGKLSIKESKRVNAIKDKNERIAQYASLFSSPHFEEALRQLRPAGRKVLLEYLKPDTIWPDVSETCGVSVPEAHRYFKESIAKIDKYIKVKNATTCS